MRVEVRAPNKPKVRTRSGYYATFESSAAGEILILIRARSVAVRYMGFNLPISCILGGVGNPQALRVDRSLNRSPETQSLSISAA